MVGAEWPRRRAACGSQPLRSASLPLLAFLFQRFLLPPSAAETLARAVLDPASVDRLCADSGLRSLVHGADFRDSWP